MFKDEHNFSDSEEILWFTETNLWQRCEWSGTKPMRVVMILVGLFRDGFLHLYKDPRSDCTRTRWERKTRPE